MENRVGARSAQWSLPEAGKSLALGGLPLGLAHQVKLTRAVAKGQSLTWADVTMDESLPAYKARREMEALFSRPGKCAAA